jgi:hypothetical protein
VIVKSRITPEEKAQTKVFSKKGTDALKEIRRKAAAGEPEAIEKVKSWEKNRLDAIRKTRAQSQLLLNLRETLLIPDVQTGRTAAQDIIIKFVETAKKYPKSRNAMFLMSAMGFEKDISTKMDEWLDRQQNKDVSFQEYRVLKLLHDKQKSAVTSTSPRQIWAHGRRFGKTYALAAKFVIEAGIHGHPTLYCHRSFDDGIKQLWSNITEIAKAADVPISSTSLSDGNIEFTSGGSIRFKGVYDKLAQNSLRGFHWKFVALDEFFFLRTQKILVEDIIEPALAEHEGAQLIASSSPPRIKDKYFEKLHETWTYFTGDMRDNVMKPHLAVEFAKKEIENGDSVTFKREWKGEWLPDYEAIVFNPCDPFVLTNPTGILLGLDWGFEDPSVVAAVAYSIPQRKCEVIYEDMWSHTGAQESTERVRRAYQVAVEYAEEHKLNTGDVVVISDNSDKQIAEDLFYGFGLPVYYAYKSHFMLGIHRMADDVSTGKLSLPAGGYCRDECDKIVYKRDELDNIIDEIDDETFHPNAMIALKYAMTQIYFKFGVPIAENADVVKSNPRAKHGGVPESMVATVLNSEGRDESATIKSSGTIKMTKVR